ncbi:MAG TPA: siderophore-interacting protein [Stackebrandtia sp.]|jgi:NADPH-dependent ferric siderophore reductase|uniref:siderophore-interacting protein n=1 Tax=Stackebrandtia sp. TaxID=2023065 RepID=UPI002D2A4B36|nr:siderophore-interacting protein [Stackebrandtia sp.]HZE41456.1 siderophore-interacting protein [Stackebrandtia sp.]
MPTPIYAEVVASRRLSPSFTRVTLGGLDPAEFRPAGYDQWFRLFLPRPGEDKPALPSFSDDSGLRTWYNSTPEAARPVIRNYTVRSFHPDGHHIDVDVVSHGDAGPASAWAAAARPGDIVGLYDQGAMFAPEPEAEWYLFVADATGLPAVAGCLASLDDGRPCRVYCQIPDLADTQKLDAPPGSHVRWLCGTDPLEAVRGDQFDPGRVRALLVGESSLVTALRRHLVNDRGVDKRDITFCGYWRR